MSMGNLINNFNSLSNAVAENSDSPVSISRILNHCIHLLHIRGLTRRVNKGKIIGFLTQSTNLIGGKETDKTQILRDLDSATKMVEIL